jgi:hypothetical protein
MLKKLIELADNVIKKGSRVDIPSGMSRSVEDAAPAGLSHPGGMRPFGGRWHSCGMPMTWVVWRFYRAMQAYGLRLPRSDKVLTLVELSAEAVPQLNK